jgi:hypothetical protein
MLPALPDGVFPIRKECPPGACVCERDRLLGDPAADTRILMLTREEEKKLIGRIENVASHAQLKHLELRMQEQLGITIRITRGSREVRSARGLSIEVAERPGLCRKTRTAIPAAIRRCLEKNPEIVYAILNADDLLGQ